MRLRRLAVFFALRVNIIRGSALPPPFARSRSRDASSSNARSLPRPGNYLANETFIRHFKAPRKRRRWWAATRQLVSGFKQASGILGVDVGVQKSYVIGSNSLKQLWWTEMELRIKTVIRYIDFVLILYLLFFGSCRNTEPKFRAASSAPMIRVKRYLSEYYMRGKNLPRYLI